MNVFQANNWLVLGENGFVLLLHKSVAMESDLLINNVMTSTHLTGTVATPVAKLKLDFNVMVI